MCCAIWYHFYNLKNIKNNHGGVFLLVKLQLVTLLKAVLLHGCFSRFLNCANGTKSCKASHTKNSISQERIMAFPCNKKSPQAVPKNCIFRSYHILLEIIFNIPAGIYLFKVNNGDTRATCKICSKSQNSMILKNVFEHFSRSGMQRCVCFSG